MRVLKMVDCNRSAPFPTAPSSNGVPPPYLQAPSTQQVFFAGDAGGNAKLASVTLDALSLTNGSAPSAPFNTQDRQIFPGTRLLGGSARIRLHVRATPRTP